MCLTESQEKTEEMARKKQTDNSIDNSLDNLFPGVRDFIGETKFVDLVLIVTSEGQYLMAEAPFCTNIKEAESVTIATETGIAQGTVIASVCTDKNSEEFAFLMKASVYEEPLPKVINRLRYEVVKWE